MSIQDLRHGDVAMIAKAKMMAELNGGGDFGATAARGFGASDRVVTLLQKAIIPGLHTHDNGTGDALADWRISANAWFSTLRTTSVFFRLWDSGLRRVPLRTHLGVTTMNATGWIVGEGQPIPLSTITLSSPELTPVKACAMLVASDELIRSSSTEALNTINAELRIAVSTVVDQKFWELIMPSPTFADASSGNTEANARDDVKALLAAVNTTGAGYLVWAMSPDVANGLSLFPDLGEGMTPQGGELLGLPAMVSNAIPAGTLRLVNGAAVAAGLGDFSLDSSGQASIQMNDTPSLGADGVLTSMWQTNSVAMKAVIDFAARRTRTDAVAQITGIGWGEVA
ncbi:phage major capsid protein [Asticcacaulis sp. YBE204]|uniref:phage major capsid family protein n=1 Tax=Asticcacaulis sp. YBE204 TaxID=1282363 RepID=UPI0003C3C778|nr:phage major capsid protein [Asticcacaulis sp. YBE204]ESQ76915.1 hypothetical protein AEYBE204_18740 [Asticcacaulis sp. YBE204]